jgi:hypothetical protein
MFAAQPLLVSTLSYAGLLLFAAAALSLLRPLRLLRIRSRRSALLLLPLALALVTTGAWWPWRERHSGGASSLDAAVPAYQFVELHETRVRGTPSAVFAAIRAVSAGEIRLYRTLTWIRQPRLPWRARRPSVLDPEWNQPFLDVATSGGFVWLADDPPQEAVVGAVVCCRGKRLFDADDFQRLVEPGYAKAAMSFRVEALPAGYCRVTTETRVFATDAPARRRFGVYWAFIYPGSALLRDGWLAAIKKRAETAGSRA